MRFEADAVRIRPNGRTFRPQKLRDLSAYTEFYGADSAELEGQWKDGDTWMRAARIHTSCAVFAAPTFDRAFARWCFTVACDRPSRWTVAFSDPASKHRSHDRNLAVRGVSGAAAGFHASRLAATVYSSLPPIGIS